MSERVKRYATVKEYHKSYWEKQKQERTCVVCGGAYKSVRESQTCSPKCRGALKTRNYSKILVCAVCGKKFKRTASNIKNGRDKTCSWECKSKWHSGLMQGENHWNWQDKKETKKCEICGKEFGFYRAKGRKHQTCSYECKYVLFSRNLAGENHYLWRGGCESWRGSNWLYQRKQALVRDDYKCQECGMTSKEQLEEMNRQLSVHHIIPFRFFGEDYEKANRLCNLITLCEKCHYSQASHRWRNDSEVAKV